MKYIFNTKHQFITVISLEIRHIIIALSVRNTIKK
jgi:hypothetical protein